MNKIIDARKHFERRMAQASAGNENDYEPVSMFKVILDYGVIPATGEHILTKHTECGHCKLLMVKAGDILRCDSCKVELDISQVDL